MTYLDLSSRVRAAANLVAPLRAAAAAHPRQPCLRFFRDGRWRVLTWGETFARVEAVAGGLAALGVGAGERVAIISTTRPEWGLADLGGVFAGAVVASVYPTLPANEIAFILKHSRTRVVFVEDEAQAAKVLSVRDELPDLRTVVLLSGVASDGVVMTLGELEARGDEAWRDVAVRRGLAADRRTPLSVVYTSGTTGLPKGVVLTHGNVLFVVAAVVEAAGEITDQLWYNLSFLPLAHVMERVAGHFFPLLAERTVTYSRGLDALGDDFRAVRPHLTVAVPRVFEKIHARVLADVARKPRPQRALFEWAVGVGRRRSLAQERGQPIGPALAAQARLADALVFRKLRDAVGGRIALLVSGGAPLSAEVARFFHGAGILVCEGWGATETSAPATLNVPSAYRFGSVGRPLPGVEVVVADDGELLVRGENVCAGYLDDPEANAETFDADGFYHSGDIGRRDEDGFFYITDRKKELIITAYGKNIAPQKIENLLRERRFISNCIVHGDRRSHLVALITIDRDDLRARRPDLAAVDATDPRLASLIGKEVDAVNAGLPSFEHIRSFRVLDHDFSPETGELTPTMKLKRRVIETKYHALLDELYQPA